MRAMRRTSGRHIRGGLVTAGLWVLIAGTLGCSQTPGAATQVLHRGLNGEPATLDPAQATDTFSYEVMDDLYEGLTSESPSGAVIPGVASGWTVSNGGTQYTFQIRPDAKWSNGQPVRAQDFIAAWQRALDPKRGSPAADNLRLIHHASAIITGKSPPSSLGVEARGDSVLIVNIEQPGPRIPSIQMRAPAATILPAGSQTVPMCWRPGRPPPPSR